ncbi:MAG: hypothetical protein II208_02685 [Alphaproteobacteria bacterium]|nr:hypothetical protein [Alphaproteobacteria bacterium]
MATGFYRAFLNFFGFGNTKPVALREQTQSVKPTVSDVVVHWDATKECLTDNKIRDFVGINYDGVMYYNFDAAAWKSDKCLGYCMPYQEKFEELMWNMKKVLEHESGFEGFELVAVVTMSIKERYFTGVGARITHPFFARNGRAVVGSIIRRDKNSGKILQMPCSWNGVDVSRLGACDAIWYGAKWFAMTAIENLDFRAELLKNHGRYR